MMSQHEYGAEKQRGYEAELLTRASTDERDSQRVNLPVTPSLRLGDKAPDFTQDSTQGPIHFYEWMGDSWAILFSHPADFTPVCTTELGMVARLKPEFDKRNVKVIGLSVDPLFRHDMWVGDIAETQGVGLNFPLLADANRKVAQLYDMIHPNAHPTETVRSVFVIDPKKTVRLMHTYPAETGRNFDELLRVVDSLQLTDRKKIATPANWKPGEDVVILPSIRSEEADRLFPKGYRELKPYLRITPEPND
jgi:alkyl hydroperoxide reductase subunit AhpC